jgi:hypothetical protein
MANTTWRDKEKFFLLAGCTSRERPNKVQDMQSIV